VPNETKNKNYKNSAIDTTKLSTRVIVKPRSKQDEKLKELKRKEQITVVIVIIAVIFTVSLLQILKM